MAKKVEEEIVNPLRNERVIVRFIPRQSHMVTDPKHILYGGMAEDAVRTFVVPRLSSGTFVNVLTNAEKAFFENYFGIDMSVHKKVDNYWSDANSTGLGKVKLKKQDNYLDLSDPEDYIRYKILLANKDFVCKSQQEYEDRPKATYQFVIISENDNVSSAKRSMNITMECYKEFGKIEDNIDMLMCVVELLDGRSVADNTSKDFLHTKIDSFIQSNPKQFLKVVKDETLPVKSLIRRSVNKGLITKRGDYYYLKSDGKPLCGDNEEPVLNTAVRYLNNPRNQEVKFSLEAQLKE